MVLLCSLGGAGELFKSQGFIPPKALVKVDSKPVLFWVFDQLLATASPGDLVCIPHLPVYDSFNLRGLLEERYPTITFELVRLDVPTRGQAETILCALDRLLELHPGCDEPVFCMDCDKFITMDNLMQAWGGANKVFACRDEQSEPIYAYLEVADGSDKIVKVSAKQKISDLASCGACGFASMQALHQYCTQLVGQAADGEMYLSHVIQLMIDSSEDFRVAVVPNKHYFSLWSPDLVERFQRCFLMDLDGTLVWTDHIYVRVWEQLLQEFGLSVDVDFFKNFIQGHSDLGFLKYLMPTIQESQIREISQRKDQKFIEILNETKEDVLIPGVKSFFQQLKNSKVAVVTSCNRAVAEFLLEYTGLDDYINILVAAEDVTEHKPNPAPYQKAMELLEVNAERCFVFEDSMSGYTAGIHAGPSKVCVFTTSNTKSDLLSSASFKFDSYASLSYAAVVKQEDEPGSPKHEGVEQFIPVIKQCLVGAPVKAVTLNDETLKTGYICDINAFTLLYNNHSKKSIVLKISNLGNELSKVAEKLDMYNNEAFFYVNLSSLMTGVIAVPECMGSFEQGGKIGILLSDLRSVGGQFDMDLSKNVSMLLKVVHEVHKMHSTYYFHDAFELIAPMQSLRTINKITYYEQLVSERFDKFASRNSIFLQPGQLEKLTAIRTNYKKILDLQSSYPLSFCHGDLKSPNLFYPTNGGSPYFLDWQYIHLNKGVSDIVFLLVESLDFNQRVVSLVENYYFQLWSEVDKTLDYEKYIFDFKCALCIFPFFVMVWFNSEDSDKLLDKSFPIRFMKKLMEYYDHYIDDAFLQQLEANSPAVEL